MKSIPQSPPLGRSALRSVTVASAMAVALASPVLAQSVFDSELRLAPQFMQYHIGFPNDETVSELAIPVYVSMPISSSFTLDIGTAYTRAHVASGSLTSDVSGLTDTQVRGNLTLGADFIVLTAGLNLPTGKSQVTAEQFAAAGRIANDFLAFPITSLGTGFGGTLGLAVARPLGEWNVGFGAAVRRSAGYEPFNIPGQELHFQPGNEYRARVGLDRGIGGGRLSLGLTYSAFGNDAAGGFAYNTGDRVITQAVYSTTLGGSDVTFAGYDVLRSSGTLASGAPSGRENIANLFASIGLQRLGTVITPSIELRHDLQQYPATTNGVTTADGYSQGSYLATLGLRTHADVGGITLFPSAGFTLGNLAVPGSSGPTHASLQGFRAQVAARFAPFAQ